MNAVAGQLDQRGAGQGPDHGVGETGVLPTGDPVTLAGGEPDVSLQTSLGTGHDVIGQIATLNHVLHHRARAPARYQESRPGEPALREDGDLDREGKPLR